MNITIDSFTGEYAWLSNFYPCVIKTQGIIYPSVENAYQAAKTLDIDERIYISTLRPGDAKKQGRKVKLRDGWESMKLFIMYELIKIKFQDGFLRSRLLATWDSILIEGNDWNDCYWGVCNNLGSNHLGNILMSIRQLLRDGGKDGSLYF